MSDEERQEAVLAHSEKREEAKYAKGPSSQDVWRQRERLVLGAFERDLEKLEKRGIGGEVELLKTEAATVEEEH